jgi:hypothetical protein
MYISGHGSTRPHQGPARLAHLVDGGQHRADRRDLCHDLSDHVRPLLSKCRCRRLSALDVTKKGPLRGPPHHCQSLFIAPSLPCTCRGLRFATPNANSLSCRLGAWPIRNPKAVRERRSPPYHFEVRQILHRGFPGAARTRCRTCRRNIRLLQCAHPLPSQHRTRSISASQPPQYV